MWIAKTARAKEPSKSILSVKNSVLMTMRYLIVLSNVLTFRQMGQSPDDVTAEVKEGDTILFQIPGVLNAKVCPK